MKIDLALGEQAFSVDVPVPDEQITVAQARYTPATKSWEEVVEDGLRQPIAAPPLRSYDLKGKKVALITDDWGRPTPAHRVSPPSCGSCTPPAPGRRTSPSSPARACTSRWGART